METQPIFTSGRIFDAPIALVWEALSKAEHLGHWWGPKDFTITVISFDFKPEGLFHYAMNLPDGSKIYGRFIYEEMIPTEKIIWRNAFADEKGNVIPAPFSADFPLEVRNTLTLTETNGQTHMHVTTTPIDASAVQKAFFESLTESMNEGYGGTWETLANYLNKL
jgi:uncharacterized protein YndB with AHSA1/START domain